MTRWSVSLSHVMIFPLLCLCASENASLALAQRPQAEDANPLSIAEDLFDRFLPAPTEADDEALSQISISRADEMRLGKSMVKAFMADLKAQRIKVVKNGKDVAYVRALVEMMRPMMRQADRYPNIEVFVVDSAAPDARSFPGGTLFFYRGLFELAESEAALVGVVGHELAHLDRGHQLLPLKQAKLFEESLTDNQQNFEPLRFLESGTRMARMLSRPFRPQDESVADEDAVTWMYSAGYEPREFSQLLVRLHDRVAARENLPLPSFLHTHPPTLERAQSVLAQLERLQVETPRSDLYIGRNNLERRKTRAEHEFDD